MVMRVNGYVVDTTYTYSFWNLTAPIRIDFAATLAGFKPPESEYFSYLELGCGQGLTINILAAVHPKGRFVGVDFNEKHIENAKLFCKSAEIDNAIFLAQSFDDFWLNSDPNDKFDYIVLHGVYTWVNEENRNYIRKIIDKLIKPGGLVYISYNSLPGSMSRSVIQRLILENAVGLNDTSNNLAINGLKLAQYLAQSGADFAKKDSDILKSISDNLSQSKNYLSHEYMNVGWSALYFSDIFEQLSEIGLDLISPQLLCHSDPDNWGLPTLLKPYGEQKSGPVWRETIRDYMNGTKFRVDIFQKGLPSLTLDEQEQALRNQSIISLLIPEEMAFPPEAATYAGIKVESFLERLAEYLNSCSYTINEILDHFKNEITYPQIIKLIRYLIDNRQIELAQQNFDNFDSAMRLNKLLVSHEPFGKLYNCLCSPVMANAFTTNHLTVLALEVFEQQGELYSSELASAMQSLLQKKNHILYNGDQPITDAVLQSAEIAKFAERFPTRILPVLKRFGIIRDVSSQI